MSESKNANVSELKTYVNFTGARHLLFTVSLSKITFEEK